MPEGGPDPFDCVSKEPAGPRGENLSTFEMDLRDWGMTFGLAYGIARGEDPYESNDSVARRALDAARMVWKGWDQDLWVWGEKPEVAA